VKLVAAILAALLLAGCGPRVVVPPVRPDAAATEREARAFVEGLKPRRPGRPVVAIVALNEGTEITDFLLPHAVLKRADVAEVVPVAVRRGPVSLYPVLQVEVAQDLAGFDRDHPAGADYVIVPALREDDDPAILAWLRQQAGKGARIIGICVGTIVVGKSGLLDGRRFATHWYYRSNLLERPGATYVPHQRYVIDRGVATTTGITASIPATLALVEALGGRAKAQAIAAELGVASWSPEHDSTPFGLNFSRAVSYLWAKAAFWRREDWIVDVRDGMDDIALALAADAWTRTGHVSIEAASPSGPVKLRSGLLLATRPPEAGARLPLAAGLKPMEQLERTLCEIAARYGAERREWVMMELEYGADQSRACETKSR
jgi:putative intracellular protease/amidase